MGNSRNLFLPLEGRGLLRALDELPLRRFHWKILLLSGLGWMFDAMDVGLMSFIVVSLTGHWSLTPLQVSSLISIGIAGMFFGAAASGTIADRLGRKTVFQLTLLIYSLATGLSALAPGYFVLIVLRFIVGFGLGGELPVASTLVSEFSPANQRGKLLVLLESFWAYGWIMAALIGYLVIPRYGWRIAFFVGAAPALYVFVLRRAIPESPRYLLNKGRLEEAKKVIVLAGASEENGAVLGTGEEESAPRATARFQDLWSRDLLRRTILLWILWFGMVFSYYGIFTWLPSILAKDFPLVKSFEYTLLITLAQIPGYFSAAYLVEKIGRKWTLTSYMLLCAVSAFLYGQGRSAQEFLLWGSLISFFNLGAWGVTYTYTPELYPTRIRAMGAGFASAFGRIGGILGPFMVALILKTWRGSATLVFSMFAAVMLAVSLLVALLGEETKGKTLEQIARQAKIGFMSQ